MWFSIVSDQTQHFSLNDASVRKRLPWKTYLFTTCFDLKTRVNIQIPIVYVQRVAQITSSFSWKFSETFEHEKNSFDKGVQKCTKLLVKETELVRFENFYSVNCWASQKNEEKLRENFLWTRFLQVVGMRESIEWFLSLFTSNQNGTSYDLDGISFSWTLLRPSSSHQFLKFFRRSLIENGAAEKKHFWTIHLSTHKKSKKLHILREEVRTIFFIPICLILVSFSFQFVFSSFPLVRPSWGSDRSPRKSSPFFILQR